MVALLTATLIVVVITTAARAADPPRGTAIANQILATWNCQDKTGVARTPAKPSPWALKGHNPAKVMNTWKTRYRKCAATLAEQKRQWNWQAWLPDKWRRIGVCETGLNWHHYNSSYEGAFGFATSSWDAFKPAGYPDHASQATPWQQYQVALNIYNRYGFSGWGCRGA